MTWSPQSALDLPAIDVRIVGVDDWPLWRDFEIGNEHALALYRHRFVDAGAIDCTGSGIASERQMVHDLQT